MISFFSLKNSVTVNLGHAFKTQDFLNVECAFKCGMWDY